MATIYEKTCVNPECKRIFTSQRSDAKTCSSACRYKMMIINSTLIRETPIIRAEYGAQIEQEIQTKTEKRIYDFIESRDLEELQELENKLLQFYRPRGVNKLTYIGYGGPPTTRGKISYVKYKIKDCEDYNKRKEFIKKGKNKMPVEYGIFSLGIPGDYITKFTEEGYDFILSADGKNYDIRATLESDPMKGDR